MHRIINAWGLLISAINKIATEQLKTVVLTIFEALNPEPLKMKSNLQTTKIFQGQKLYGLRQLFQTIFIFIAIHSTSQNRTIPEINSFFEYDSTFVFRVPHSSFHLNSVQPLVVITDQDQEFGYSFLGLSHEDKTINILQFDLNLFNPTILTIPIDDKAQLHPRSDSGILFSSHRKKHLYLKVFDRLLEISTETRSILNSTAIDSKYTYFQDNNGTLNLGYYYNEYLSRDKTGLGILVDSKLVKETHPEADFIQLTHFHPCNLIDFNREYIAWLSVSKPVLKLYNQELELINEVHFDDHTWVDAENIKKLPKYKKLLKEGIFEFGSAALEDTLSKNLSVQFMNDSTLLVTTNYTTKKIQENIFVIRQGQLYLTYSRTIQIDRLINCHGSPEGFELFLQSAIGTTCNNRLYFMTVGSGKMDWESSPTEIDYSQYVYLHLNCFDFKPL